MICCAELPEMGTTEQRLAANRTNAQLSTGPSTAEGKAAASKNAMRHGLLSRKLLLDDEDPEEFAALAADLVRSLGPVGIAEAMLVERIAVTIWRQRRLVQAETASLTLSRQPVPIAKSASQELGRGYSSEIKPEHLVPFDTDREAWAKTALAEIDALEVIDLRSIAMLAPTVNGQLVSDADGEAPETFLAGHSGGLTGYIAELAVWCRKELSEATVRPHLLSIAEQVRARNAVLPSGTLEVLSRYQTMLDNQLFKALRALREAQDWRLKTLETAPSSLARYDAAIADLT